jgi:DNA-directed RNA polymerase specialized sigma24 family protein
MDIVEELRQNREAGARRLESEYKVGLVSFARRLCANPSDAEELVNRTFAAVIEGIDDYLEQSAFFGWMCKIMMNINAADHRRRADRDVVYPGNLPDVADDDAGYSDEVRLRHGANDEDWVKAEYQTVSNDAFLSYAPAERLPRHGLVIMVR